MKRPHRLTALTLAFLRLSPLSPVVARAEMTRHIAHGDRYLLSRLVLADGRIVQQINPGLLEADARWTEVERSEDLGTSLAKMRREGWTITEPMRVVADSVRKAVLVLMVIALTAGIATAAFGATALVSGGLIAVLAATTFLMSARLAVQLSASIRIRKSYKTHD